MQEMGHDQDGRWVAQLVAPMGPQWFMATFHLEFL